MSAARAAWRLRDFGITPLFIGAIVLLTVANQLGFIAFILIMQHMTDGVMETQNASTLYAFIALFLVMIAMATGYHHLRALMLASVAERFTLRLRAEALQAAVRNAVRTDATEGAAVLRDIATVHRFFTSRSPAAFLELISAFTALGLMFSLNTGLGLIGIAGIVAVTAMGIVMHRSARGPAGQAAGRLQATQAELGGQLVHPDLVRGVGLLRATMLRWQRRYDAALDDEMAMRRRTDALREIQAVLTDGILMAAIAYASYLIFRHEATLTLLIAAYFLVGYALAPFSGLIASWDAWGTAAAAWTRLRSVLSRDGAAPARPPEAEAPPGLLVEDLTFWPEGRERAILAGIGFHLPPGTVMLVQGRNGAGKSTLLRLVLGLLQPTDGRVLLSGQDTYFCDRAEFGPRVGYLPQDVQLLEGDVYANIGRGPEAPAEAVVAAARAAGAHEMIGRLPMGYQTPSGTTSGLSAGQRRLIGLARALYGNPELLVLDEPEVGLDGTARAIMQRAVERARSRGAAVLVVTHEPRTWAAVADLRLLLAPDGTWQVQPADRDPEPLGGRLATVG